jgi:hypothetical protein
MKNIYLFQSKCHKDLVLFICLHMVTIRVSSYLKHISLNSHYISKYIVTFETLCICSINAYIFPYTRISLVKVQYEPKQFGDKVYIYQKCTQREGGAGPQPPTPYVKKNLHRII